MSQDDYTRTRESFKSYLKSKGFATKSIKSRLIIFNQYLKWIEKENLEIEQVGYNDLLLFMKHCRQEGRSQRTIQHYLIVIKHFYEHLVKKEAIAINPVADIEVKGMKRKILYHILKPQELHRLYNLYDEKTLTGERNKVLLGLLVYQGLRTEDLSQLQVDHIKLKEGKIDVPGGRNRNGRLLGLEAYQIMDLYNYILQVRPKILEISGEKTNRLLVSPEGGTQTSNFMTSMMAGVKKISRSLSGPAIKNARQIRASVIVKWLKQYNLRQVQYMAGHRYISSTEAYKQSEMEGLREEIQQYHPLG